jgi:hypothetical protein
MVFMGAVSGLKPPTYKTQDISLQEPTPVGDEPSATLQAIAHRMGSCKINRE